MNIKVKIILPAVCLIFWLRAVSEPPPRLARPGPNTPASPLRSWVRSESAASALRVLYLAGSGIGIAQYEAIAVARSLNWQLDLVPLWFHPFQLEDGDPAAAELLRRYLTQHKYDLIVLTQGGFGTLPQDCRTRILALIRDAGVGLLYVPSGIVPRVRALELPDTEDFRSILPMAVGRDYDHATSDVVAVSDRPFNRKNVTAPIVWRCNVPARLQNGGEALLTSGDGVNLLAAAGEYGRGRIVMWNHLYGEGDIGEATLLPWGGHDAKSDKAEAARPSRANRFIAGYDFADQFYSWVGQAARWAARREPELELVRLEANPDEITFAVANRTGAACDVIWSVDERKGSVTVPTEGMEVSLPARPEKGEVNAGTFIAGIELTDPAGNTLDWGSVTVPAVKTADWSCTPEAPVYPADGTLRLDWRFEAEAGDHWEVALYDLAGNLLLRRRGSVAVGTMPLEVNLADLALTDRMLCLRFRVYDHDLYQEMRDSVWIKQIPEWGTFHIQSAASGMGPNPAYDVLYRVLRGMGVDSIGIWYPDGVSLALSAETGMVPWLNWVRDMASTPEALTHLARMLDMASPLEYGLQDEPELQFAPATEVRFAPGSEREEFEEFLRKRCGTIEALNTRWGSHYPDFSSVEQRLGYEVLATDNWCAWFDARRNADRMMAARFSALHRAIRDGAPGSDASVNLRSLETFSGIDLELWRDFGGMYLYNDYVRGDSDFGYLQFGRDRVRHAGSYIGYTWTSEPAPELLLRDAFDAVRRGANVISWFAPLHDEVPTPQTRFSYLDGDFTRNAKGDSIAGINAMLLAGPGDLAVASEPWDEGIFIYYPRPIFYVNTLAGMAAQAADPAHAPATWTGMAPYGSLPCGFARPLNAAGFQYRIGGELTPELLARTRLLLLPNALCLGRGELEQIRDFVHHGGTVVVTGNAARRDGDGVVYSESPDSFVAIFGVRRTEVNLSPVSGGDRFTAAGATALAPGIWRHGNAFLIEGGDTEAAAHLPEVLAAAGIEPDFRVSGASLVARQYDGNGYLFVLGQSEPTRLQVELPAEFDLYEVASRRNRGRARRIDEALEPWGVRVFALAPRRTETLELQLSAPVHAGAAYALELQVPGQEHALIALASDAPEIVRLPRVWHWSAAEPRLKLWMPLNAPTKRYRIAARDLTGGAETELELVLQPVDRRE